MRKSELKLELITNKSLLNIINAIKFISIRDSNFIKRNEIKIKENVLISNLPNKKNLKHSDKIFVFRNIKNFSSTLGNKITSFLSNEQNKIFDTTKIVEKKAKLGDKIEDIIKNIIISKNQNSCIFISNFEPKIETFNFNSEILNKFKLITLLFEHLKCESIIRLKNMQLSEETIKKNILKIKNKIKNENY